MAEQPLVSVIMNCFNGEKYLQEAIDSVIAQTYENWELIFWDNQSTDSSAEIVNKYKDNRVRYFYAPQHTKLYQARNEAYKKCQGELISLLDTDDCWEKEKLEKQIIKFQKKEIGLVYGNFELKDIPKGSVKKKYKGKLAEGNITNELLRAYHVSTLTLIFRKKYAEKLEYIFDSNYNLIGDFDFVIRLSEICEFGAIQEKIGTCLWTGENLSITGKEDLIKERLDWIKKNEIKFSRYRNFKYLVKENKLLIVKEELKKLKDLKEKEQIKLTEILEIILKKMLSKIIY